MEPLVPKLRGYFAEFLSEGYLVRLGIFYPPTCVGLRYGQSSGSLRGFSRQCGIIRVQSYDLARYASALMVSGFTSSPA